ncbi:PREDICTED: Down syndrome critical region protein 3-like [Priapulus caudatus]|uniref:Down syndrome critical region protein 3-like n=1 Tax=Priapulus caudatus TaxID=37621 RepID=A0ABM1DQC6_PRICU|nr:PREDICTED: Down syndrome critical region protein 3-like [Priapulus caudatus]
MAAVLDIRLKKVNKVYRQGDMVSGVVVIQSRGELSHQGVVLTMEGSTNLQLSAKSVGVFEAFYNSLKPIQILHCTLELAKPGKFPSGDTEIPFEFPLRPKTNKTLYETYHGVFVNIQYVLRCEMKRPLLAKDLLKTCEFIVEYRDDDDSTAAAAAAQQQQQGAPLSFTITPESLRNVGERERAAIPGFAVRGRLDSTTCRVTRPLTGELVVERSEAPIKSIELQLVRVETCGCAEGYAKDATEIQNIQIGEGDVCRGVAVPIHMVFPRLFTCPTLSTNNFKVEFEVNLVIIFQDDRLVTENFPVKLTRF